VESISGKTKHFGKYFFSKGMNIKERLLQFIDYKGLSKRKFCEKISVSHTYINDLKTMQSDKLVTISDVFPDLDLTWLITGRGEMTVYNGPELIQLGEKNKFKVNDPLDMLSNELVENKAMLRTLLQVTGELLAGQRKESPAKTLTDVSKATQSEILHTLDELQQRYG
jgi:hypothetical protein